MRRNPVLEFHEISGRRCVAVNTAALYCTARTALGTDCGIALGDEIVFGGDTVPLIAPGTSQPSFLAIGAHEKERKKQFVRPDCLGANPGTV